jgi:hypothetical protein
MKRTIFKIGRYAKLKTQTKTDYSFLDWDIDERLEKDDIWDLKFSTQKNNSNSCGTEIEITRLNEDITEISTMDTFQSNLQKKIALAYALFIEC